MEKAFDFAVLAEKLKGRGLDVAEAGAVAATEEILMWLEESFKVSENKFDDMLLLGMPMLKETLMLEIDKINGKVG